MIPTTPMLNRCIQGTAFGHRPRGDSIRLRKNAAREWWPRVQSIFGASVISRVASVLICFGILIISSVVLLFRGKLTIWKVLGGLTLTAVVSAITPTFTDRLFGFKVGGGAVRTGGGFGGRLKPMFYFCSTTHGRFSPTKHSFKYPLLYVGFPVTLKGTVGGGSLFSVKPSLAEINKAKAIAGEDYGSAGGNDGSSGPKEWRTLFTVDPAKYLNPELPFDEKLQDVLSSHVSSLNPPPPLCGGSKNYLLKNHN